MIQNEELKLALEENLKATITELEVIAKQNPVSGDWVAVPDTSESNSADQNIEADAVEEWNSRRALVSQLETRYQNIKQALEKISNGTYGICEISGKEIEIERLKANPAARTNIANRDKEDELSL